LYIILSNSTQITVYNNATTVAQKKTHIAQENEALFEHVLSVSSEGIVGGLWLCPYSSHNDDFVNTARCNQQIFHDGKLKSNTENNIIEKNTNRRDTHHVTSFARLFGDQTTKHKNILGFGDDVAGQQRAQPGAPAPVNCGGSLN
jgi:hypothetical protein